VFPASCQPFLDGLVGGRPHRGASPAGRLANLGVYDSTDNRHDPTPGSRIALLTTRIEHGIRPMFYYKDRISIFFYAPPSHQQRLVSQHASAGASNTSPRLYCGKRRTLGKSPRRNAGSTCQLQNSLLFSRFRNLLVAAQLFAISKISASQKNQKSSQVRTSASGPITRLLAHRPSGRPPPPCTAESHRPQSLIILILANSCTIRGIFNSAMTGTKVPLGTSMSTWHRVADHFVRRFHRSI